VDEIMRAWIPETGDRPRKHHHEPLLFVTVRLRREIIEFDFRGAWIKSLLHQSRAILD
jgi:hypothetical protein